MSTTSLAFSDNAPIIAQYEPPTDLSPGEVGFLYDGVFGQREVAATLIDLAVRGYIALHEVSNGYEIELLRQDDSILACKVHEKLLLDGLFQVVSTLETARIQASVTDEQARENIARYYADQHERPSMVGTIVSGNELREKITILAGKTEEVLQRELRAAGYYKNPIVVPAIMSTLGVIVAVIVMQTVSIGVILLLIIVPTLAALVAYRGARARTTRLGRRAKKYIEGFRLYLSVAEVHRYRGTQAPETAEKDNTHVVLYEKYLAYAIALGLEGEWAGQFSSLEHKTPFAIGTLGGLITGLGALLLVAPARR